MNPLIIYVMVLTFYNFSYDKNKMKGLRFIKYSISLAYIKNDFQRNPNIIIHHGLMGSSKNFKSISKNANFSNYANSYLIDARNHG